MFRKVKGDKMEMKRTKNWNKITMIAVNCPYCQFLIDRVDFSSLGSKVRCPYCGETFILEEK